MKLKYFLRGLGAGIVVTALILCIAYRSSSSGQSVVEQAKELGMVFPEGTAAPLAATGQPAEETETPQKETATPTPKETAAATQKPKKTAQPKETADESTKGTKFTVRGGLLSSSVAREMMEAGIIESDTALDEYLEESGYSREIRAGTYFIPDGASYEEIAEIITGRE